MFAYSLITTFPCMVCLFWTAVLALDWRTAYPAKRMLAVFMAVCTALYACHAMFFNAASGAMPLADTVYAVCNLAVFPLYYLYICRLAAVRALGWRRLLVFLPAVVVGLWTAALHSFFPGNDAAFTACTSVARMVFFLQVLAVCFRCARILRAFDKRIEDCYSDTDSRSVSPTRRLTVVLVVCSLCSGLANIVGREYFAGGSALLVVPSFTFGALLFAIGYVGTKQVFSIDDFERDNPFEQDNPEQGCILTEDEADTADSGDDSPSPAAAQLARQLDSLMTTQRLYLQPDLRLSDLAAHMNMGRSALSALINQSLGMSFSDYVNTQRVRHAKKLIVRAGMGGPLSMLQVSEQSGFTTESSFYRTFRKLEGITPRQWAEAREK